MKSVTDAVNKQERHGKRDFPEYLVWTEMKQRCLNSNHSKYIFYGARGIKVCAAWAQSFETFIRDMGRRPRGLTLDRIDCNGDYEPSNCRWASWHAQRRNRRSNIWIEFNGRCLILEDWAVEMGLSPGTLRARIVEYGWSVERALTELPSTQRSSNRWITFKGVTKIAVDWAREYGISYQTLKTRLNKMKWPVEKAITTPVR